MFEKKEEEDECLGRNISNMAGRIVIGRLEIGQEG